jgi:non-specific serine/threonine protein kinase
VPGLSLPASTNSHLVETAASSDAVSLFMQRAGHARPGFELTAQNASAVVQVCLRLDGIPLALELAAARINMLTVQQIASRLDDSLGLLTGGSRTAPDRQRTLRGTLDWSYALLSEPERALFARLAVFASGWTLEAAEAVCADADLSAMAVLDYLGSLVNKSLVAAEERGQSVWYRFLDPLRAYAMEKLISSDELLGVRSRHRDWYVQLAERFEKEWRGPQQLAWSRNIDREQANIRAALRFCLDRCDIAEGLRLAGALLRFWDLHGRLTEGRAWLAELLEASTTSVPDSIRAKALGAAGFLAVYQGDRQAANPHLAEALRLYRVLGDDSGIAFALITLGTNAQTHDSATAQALCEEGLGVARRAGDRVGAYWALHMLARLALRQRDYDRGQALIEEGLALKRQQGDSFGIASSLYALGQLAWERGELEPALRLVRESLVLLRDLGHSRSIAIDLMLLACITAERGQVEHAVRLFAAVEELQANLGDKRTASVVLNIHPSHTEASLAASRAKLTPVAFEAAVAAGQAMTLDEAVECALSAAPTDASLTDAATPGDTQSGLTRRETDILRLVASGNSNKQIASELVLSLRTVERHIANVYAKLGARNRADATAYALRHDIA